MSTTPLMTSAKSTAIVQATSRGALEDRQIHPPLPVTITAVFLICCISCSSQWSSGITKAMKSTVKSELDISNTQFSLLEASEDFMATLLLLLSGVLTDRMGGAVMMVYGKMLYTLGSIFIAAAATLRSFEFMILGRIIAALGHISTEIAGFKMFSSWFPPSQGFASTLGFEGAASAIGGFVGKATANVIAKNRGFEWSFWTAAFVNIFGNFATVAFWFLNRYRLRNYKDPEDPATGENLRNTKFSPRKILELPWMFWSVMAISLWISSLASVFGQNATELAEKRFSVDPVTAGWYSAAAQYGGVVIMPILGIFLDIFGQRATILLISASSLLLSMLLLNFAVSVPGTIATFVIYAFVKAIAPTAVVDSFRATLWEESVFGSALSLKETMNATVNIIIRMITGAIQDADDDSYVGVVKVYLVMAWCAMAVGTCIFVGAVVSPNLAPLQWTRQHRSIKGPSHLGQLRENHLVLHARRTRLITVACCGILGALTLVSWGLYIWGAVTGNNV